MDIINNKEFKEFANVSKKLNDIGIFIANYYNKYRTENLPKVIEKLKPVTAVWNENAVLSDDRGFHEYRWNFHKFKAYSTSDFIIFTLISRQPWTAGKEFVFNISILPGELADLNQIKGAVEEQFNEYYDKIVEDLLDDAKDDIGEYLKKGLDSDYELYLKLKEKYEK